ncbi:sodium:alanine symporter family protein [Enterocloster clostridioformis]|uniref:alanine/glycine:cation symporter family protein n=1 Tax=Enterocloster clostridioformis TaxID=1531 RepID=UPI00080C5653|nr:sodium:alanine symporter family protein [Enterocloster clostridioformis]ANU46850.1 sodium:alanine symporter family protein [Lachnoclostridium sp. YL32]NDO26920.1 sodium:alanine symporter family protein [Enterocloster clostridioformis]OXE62439.1 sodium:alanine symporter family protein [Enterocloster clostridioformis]QQQ98445.1 sodium:alanine symporter family protein [Enterocloster clostridioformis]
MDVITNLVAKGNSFLWSFLLIVLLCGTGIYYTIRLRFIQVRKFGEGWKLVFGHLSLNGEKHEKGEMSPFQSIATAIAAQVGTGNLAGAATALLGGGPGAIFWMWVSAFFGMSTIYAEATLAQNFKTEINGEVTGGPVYYIKAAFKGTLGKVLAGLFAIFIVLALGFMGNMVQANSIGAAFTEAFGAFNITISPVVIGVIVAAVAAFVFLGGTQRLASVVEKVVPIMAGVYIVGSLILIIMNITNLPAAIKMIFVGAFDPQAVLGAGAGIAVKEAIRFGVARGLFSNEAGMGSTPHAHARATAENPHKQGLCAMLSVFIDTFVILNLTVFSVLTTGALESGKNGTALTQAAFMKGFGTFGIVFVAVCLLFFAFSTILGWHFFGLINAKYLFGDKAAKVYSLLVVACIIIGSALKLELVWDLADFFNGLMVIPNAMALLALSGLVVKICNKYSDK